MTKKCNKQGMPQPKQSAAKAKTETKKERVLALLRRDGGASLAEITGTTGWLPHTARAMLTGIRKAGHTITKGSADGVTRWSITASPAS